MAQAVSYGSRWRTKRKQFLEEHPLCHMHSQQGIVEKATVVDHIIPHRGDPQLFWDSSNWQALCKSCHDSHKQRLEKSGVSVGCDISGIPLDPKHHWK